MERRCLVALALAACAAACSDDGGALPAFPADYADSYVEVRDCRRSGDHDLHYIRILASPDAAAAYLDRDQPFPDSAVVIKEEYDFADDTCSGEILVWTAMVRLAEGSSPETLDWAWSKVDADRTIVSENEPRCIGCHELCTDEVEGYFNTCAVP